MSQKPRSSLSGSTLRFMVPLSLVSVVGGVLLHIHWRLILCGGTEVFHILLVGVTTIPTFIGETEA